LTVHVLGREAHQPRQAAAELARLHRDLRAVAPHDGHAELRGVQVGRAEGQAHRRGAGHQRLAALRIDGRTPVLADGRVRAQHGVQLAEQAVALVEQRVGGRLRASAVLDPAVDLGERTQRIVRLGDLTAHAGLRAIAKLEDPRIQLPRALGELLDALQHRRAGRRVARAGREVGETADHVVEGCAQPGLRIGEQSVQPCERVAAGTVLRRDRAVRDRLAGEELVVGAAHAARVDAAADVALGAHVALLLEDHLASHVARRCGVRDVLPGGLQLRVGRAHRAAADPEEVGHRRLPVTRPRAAARAPG
jgi:hypothetical protein